MNIFNISFEGAGKKLTAVIDVNGMRDYHNYEVTIQEDISPLSQKFSFILFKKDLTCAFASKSKDSANIAKNAWKMIATHEKLVDTLAPATMM